MVCITFLLAVSLASPIAPAQERGYQWEATPLNGTVLQSNLGRMIAHPTDPSTLYLCTVSSLDPVTGTPGPGDGLWVTRDAGNTWSQLSDASLAGDAEIMDIAICQSSPNTLVVGTKEDGVFRSTDGGSSWSPIHNGLGFPNANWGAVAVAMDPGNANRIYLSVAQTAGFDLLNPSPNHPGFFFSLDGGQSWTSNNSGLPPRYDSTSDGKSRTGVAASIVVLPQSPNYVLLGMLDVHINTVILFGSKKATSSGQVYFSASSGAGTFQKANSGLPTQINQSNSLGTSTVRVSSSTMILMAATGPKAAVWASHTGLTFDIDLATNVQVNNRSKGIFFTKNGSWTARNADLPYIANWTDPASNSALTLKIVDATPAGAVGIGSGPAFQACMVGSLRSDAGDPASNNTKVYGSLDSGKSGWMKSWDSGLDFSPTLGYSEANANLIVFNADMSAAFATIRWSDTNVTTPLSDDDGVYRLRIQ